MRDTATLDIANQNADYPCPSQRRQQDASVHGPLHVAAGRLSFLANNVTTFTKDWG